MALRKFWIISKPNKYSIIGKNLVDVPFEIPNIETKMYETYSLLREWRVFFNKIATA